MSAVRWRWLALAAGLVAAPAVARDSLGMFEGWGAFRDPGVPRCYAIAMPDNGGKGSVAYADVGVWPRRHVRGQVHFRLSKPPAGRQAPRLAIGGQRFALMAGVRDAWVADSRADAAVLAAMRSAATMTVSAREANGRLFTDSYKLAGAASAIDSALVGCAGGG